MKTPSRFALRAFSEMVSSLDALRNGSALYLLLAGFSGGGLLLAMARSAAARAAVSAELAYLVLAVLVAFYGANAAGLVLMDQAAGRPRRPVPQALADAVRPAARLLGVLLVVAMLGAAVAAGCGLLLAGGRLPAVGPALFGLAVPAVVLVLGGGAAVLAFVVGPLAAPAAWSGAGMAAILRFFVAVLRQRLPEAVLLTLALGALTGGVAALATFVVAAGARGVLLLADVAGLDLPVAQWLAGLYGYGPRSLGAAGQPIVQDARAAAALVGGGLVFTVALVVPGLVYLRGSCALYRVLNEAITRKPTGP